MRYPIGTKLKAFAGSKLVYVYMGAKDKYDYFVILKCDENIEYSRIREYHRVYTWHEV